MDENLVIPKWNPETFKIERYENGARALTVRDNRVDPKEYYGEFDASNGVQTRRFTFKIEADSVEDAFTKYDETMALEAEKLKTAMRQQEMQQNAQQPGLQERLRMLRVRE